MSAVAAYAAFIAECDVPVERPGRNRKDALRWLNRCHDQCNPYLPCRRPDEEVLTDDGWD